jgi:transcription elongation factor/antiterminator RfaH
MKNWYALYTRPRHEKKAYDLLIEKGENAYLPLLKTVRIYKNRKKKVELPLFPSYMFCEFEYKKRFDILETHGIIKIVNFNGEPAIVPNWQIEAMQTMLTNPESLRLENYFRQGELVEVLSGPFKGLQGTVVNKKGESRLVITIDGIMQTLSVEIDADNLKAVTA